METITYQGRQIQAETVNAMSGDLAIAPGKQHQGDEEVLRDGTGQYYLRRRLHLLDVFTPEERPASGQTLTRRLSLTAAACWAVARTNPQDRALRSDLTRALAASRAAVPAHRESWLDGHASYLLHAYVESRGVDIRDALSGAVDMAFSDGELSESEAVEEAKLRRLKTGGLFPMQGVEVSEEGDEVTVPLTLPRDLYRRILAMASYDKSGDFSATVVRRMEGDVEAWIEAPNTNPTPAEFLVQYEAELDAGEHPEAYPVNAAAPGDDEEDEDEEGQEEPSLSVLDYLDANLGLEVARFLYLVKGRYKSADVVNGCVAYALQHTFNVLRDDLEGRVPEQSRGYVDNGWGYVEEFISDAAHRRSQAAHRRASSKQQRQEEKQDAQCHGPQETAAPRSATRQQADGSMEVVLHLQPEVARLVRAVGELEEDTPLGVLYQALKLYVVGALCQGGAEREEELHAEFNGHLPDQDLPTPPPSAYSLDAKALALVRRFERVTGHETADIVSGVVAGWLEQTLEYKDQRQEPDWYFTAEHVEEARRRRRGFADEESGSSGTEQPFRTTDEPDHSYGTRSQPEAPVSGRTPEDEKAEIDAAVEHMRAKLGPAEPTRNIPAFDPSEGDKIQAWIESRRAPAPKPEDVGLLAASEPEDENEEGDSEGKKQDGKASGDEQEGGK